MSLVERILLALVEFLLDELYTLLSPQTRVLLLHLGHSARLIRRISSLESSLRMAIDLRRLLACQRQGV